MGSGCGSVVERSHPTPEIRGSNPVMGKFCIYPLTVNCIEKGKIDHKEAVNDPIKKVNQRFEIAK